MPTTPNKPAALEAVAWMPIESAPKDGSYVDLWCAPLTEAGTALLPCRIPNCYWVEDYAAWYASSLRGEPKRVWHRVTHWMTCPDAPGAETPLTDLTKAQERIDRLEELVARAKDIFENCSVTDGTCCCGDSMEKHANPMFCGHSPVDHGAYQASQWLESLAGDEQ